MEEQIELLKALWTQETVNFNGRWDEVAGLASRRCPYSSRFPYGLAQAVHLSNALEHELVGTPMVGSCSARRTSSRPSRRYLSRRNGSPRGARGDGAEAGVAVVGPREAEWPRA
ncbi:MAG: hypothetical protein CM1200mP9_01910 [Gammaproteobacteria bacterium]|nr:MAG: hypothetical protein CM1200mP9_01910 [Gammaproteobacteria bacterium]